MGPAADTRQLRHRPFHSGLSLPVSPTDRLGQDWNRGKRVEKAELEVGKGRKISDCLVGNRHQSIEFLRGRRVYRSLGSTRGDLVELTVRQLHRTFSIR